MDQAVTKRTVATLDGLRLAAALLVVLYHYFFLSWAEHAGNSGIRDMVGEPYVFPEVIPYSSIGWVGVEIFFVISGFVITLSANGKTAAQFAISRFTRLFPALFCFATLAWLAVLSSGVLPLAEASMRYARMVVLFPIGPWIDGAVWTLIAELVFYVLIWAVLLCHMEKRLSIFIRIALALNLVFWAAILIAPVVGQDLFALAASYKFRVSLISTGCFFLLGMFAQEIYSEGPTRNRFVLIIASAGCCLVSLYAMAINSTGAKEFGQGPTLTITVWLLFIWIGAIGLAWEWRGRVPPEVQRILREIGLLTYPLYLVHQISGGWLLGHCYAVGLSPYLSVVVTTCACLLISRLFSRFAEPPLRRLVSSPFNSVLRKHRVGMTS